MRHCPRQLVVCHHRRRCRTTFSFELKLLAWTGFLVLSWSPSVIPVLLISSANLVPRATENHKWYLNQTDPEEKARRQKAVEEFQKRYAK